MFKNLLERGDLLFRRPSGEIVRVQAPFVNEVEIQDHLLHQARLPEAG